MPYNEILSDYDNDKNIFDDNVFEYSDLKYWSLSAEFHIRKKMAKDNVQLVVAATEIYSQEPFCHVPNTMRLI